MAFVYIPIALFSEENFQSCIVTKFPENGKIVDTMVVEKTAWLMVEAEPDAPVSTAHFHIVPVLQPLYADGHKYVATFRFEKFQDIDLAVYTVIQITEGDYGVYSQEFLDKFGQAEKDRIIAKARKNQEQTDETLLDETQKKIEDKDLPGDVENESMLRDIWNFEA